MSEMASVMAFVALWCGNPTSGQSKDIELTRQQVDICRDGMLKCLEVEKYDKLAPSKIRSCAKKTKLDWRS